MVYKIWNKVSEKYGRLYLKESAAKAAIKTGSWYVPREALEIHAFQISDAPNMVMDSRGNLKCN